MFEIQRSSGLIQQDKRCPLSEYARKGHPCPLTTGELVKPALTEVTNVRQTKAGASPREGGGFAPGQGERGRKGRDRSKYKQGRRGKRSW